MDQIFSARIDEAVHRRITELARRLKTTKKSVVERAILDLARQIDEEEGTDVFAQTLGAWEREETAPDSIEHSKRAFRDGMERHHR